VRRLFILSGPVHSGKTSFVAGRVGEALKRGIRPVGYLSPAAWEGGRPEGYDLLSIPGGRCLPFLRRSGGDDWQRVGPYFLVPETLALAQAVIRGGAGSPLLIVDEIGPLELQGRGVRSAVEELLSRPPEKLLLVVREGLVDVFRKNIPVLREAVVIEVGDREKLDWALGRADQ
jgi:nucleoside-triphosphatase THEP1